MAIVCGISGMPPQEAVLSSTGYVFERRLIEKHIDTTGTCPITKEPLRKEDLRPINVGNVVKARPASATSIPGLLSLLQSEWDGLVGETFALKMQLDTVRQQLSHALYQYDAATRVVGRLLKEREAASLRLEALQNQISTAQKTQIELGVPEELTEQISNVAKQLLAARRKRVLPPLVPTSELAKMAEKGSYSYHSVAVAGVQCVKIHPNHNSLEAKEGPIVVSGGIDATVCVFDLKKEQLLAKLQGHMKTVTDIAIPTNENVVVSSSADKTLRIWKGDETHSFVCAHTLRRPDCGLNAVAMHPVQSHVADCGVNSTWAFHDIVVGRTLKINRDLPSEYFSLRFHPDGLIMAGAAQDGQIYIWDVKAMQQRTALTGHTGSVTKLCFSENGYYLASASLDGTIRLWDLRKSLTFHVVQQPEKQAYSDVAFDSTGLYLAAASSDVSLHVFENRSSLTQACTLNSHTKPVTAVDVGYNASFLVSASLDRTVRLYKPDVEIQG